MGAQGPLSLRGVMETMLPMSITVLKLKLCDNIVNLLISYLSAFG